MKDIAILIASSILWLCMFLATLVSMIVVFIGVGVGLHYHPKPLLPSVLIMSLSLVPAVPPLLFAITKLDAIKSKPATLYSIYLVVVLSGVCFVKYMSDNLAKDTGDKFLYMPILTLGVLLIAAVFLEIIKSRLTAHD